VEEVICGEEGMIGERFVGEIEDGEEGEVGRVCGEKVNCGVGGASRFVDEMI
jgi:hypothetical protein